MEPLFELNFKQLSATRLFIVLAGFLSYLLVKDSTKMSMILGAVLALTLRSPTMVYAVLVTFRRDVVSAYRFIKLNIYISYMEYKNWTVARIFEERVKEHPQRNCFLMDDRKWTFRYVDEYTNKVGAYFKSQGLRRGDCVALLMEARPEYPCVWLGLSKIGIVSALINTNLRRDTLLHSVKVSSAKAIVVGTDLAPVLKEVLQSEAISKMAIYQFSDDSQRDLESFELLEGAIDLSAELKRQQAADLSKDISEGQINDKLLYVYTSGTTGLPKAAPISNLRYLLMASGIFHMLALRREDVIYNSLPLYHTAGGILGVGVAILHGCTVALRKKFSASNFWKDCIRYDASVAQYIGELCRYLLSTPVKPEDTQHHIRLMFGNGLRPQIWSQFVSRFNIPSIGELYGSTEGNSNLANITGHVGAVGFVPIALRSWYPVQIIKCDEETGEPIRDRHTGFCVRCSPGETGLFVGRVNPRRAVTAFNGYADKEASEKKLLRNVFKKGDVYFNSGDMVIGDLLGYFYFKDRTGDTFRWRGENVATQEVEAIITNVIGLQDCVVYGVEIPYVEGKAGMAAIEDPDKKVDLRHLSIGIRGTLPTYAQPLFIRIMEQIPRTATFKMKKRDLMEEAFDIRRIKDPIYYLNKDGIYRPLTQDQFEALLSGKAGL